MKKVILTLFGLAIVAAGVMVYTLQHHEAKAYAKEIKPQVVTHLKEEFHDVSSVTFTEEKLLSKKRVHISGYVNNNKAFGFSVTASYPAGDIESELVVDQALFDQLK
ncbi:DUF1433 domain-containing protein [Bacillus sp. CBEL-1]|uniref:DUF1433 domain-containing protein n=1 Tax=Bacillus sp. CBEL-1 TaxID=2502980 RepID=UPI0010449B65|nr:DUF1433 domain-containing protein [Bacillus sp. CBEL-1]TDB55413.1 DUF1433 domain-containing protein [Bacillus sp. CBEL-1]